MGNDSVKLWLVIEEDRGYGASVTSSHTSEAEAMCEMGPNEYVDYVYVSRECLNKLVSQEV